MFDMSWLSFGALQQTNSAYINSHGKIKLESQSTLCRTGTSNGLCSTFDGTLRILTYAIQKKNASDFAVEYYLSKVLIQNYLNDQSETNRNNLFPGVIDTYIITRHPTKIISQVVTGRCIIQIFRITRSKFLLCML